MNIPSHLLDDILASLETPRSGDAADKRRATRMKMQPPLETTIGEGGACVAVKVLDLSPRGICLAHPTMLHSGDQFIIRLPREAGPVVPMLCTVVHCRRDDAGWRIGAEFTCVLSESAGGSDPQSAEIERIRKSIFA